MNTKNYFTKHLPLAFHLGVTLAILALFTFFAFRFKPAPVSDFLTYWSTSTNISNYLKGGLLFTLYAPFKLGGVPPYLAALMVNGVCFIGMAWLTWLNTKNGWQYIATLALLLIGIWFTGYAPIVNSDLPTVTLFLLGLAFLNMYRTEKSTVYLVSAAILYALSLSLRSQLFYISCAFLVIACIWLFIALIQKKTLHKHILIFAIQFIFIALVLAFTANTSLEMHSKGQASITIHKRATIYTGLLSTSWYSPACGRYNREAITRTEAEVHTPMSRNIVEGLKKIPIERLSQTVLCKWNMYLFEYNQSGFDWLVGHIQAIKPLTKRATVNFVILNYVENFSVRLLKIIGVFLMLLAVYRWKSLSKSEQYLTMATFLTTALFFGIHTILEIQARYIIPPVLITTVVLLYVHAGKIEIVTKGKKNPEEGT